MYMSNNKYIHDLQNAIEATIGIQSLFHTSVLITGATGLIGSFLVDMLMYSNESMDADIEVYALIRDSKRARERFSSSLDKGKLVLLEQDVTEQLKYDINVNYIIHAAGDGYPAAFREHPVETMTPAIIGTYNLLQFSKKCGAKRMLYISSGEVYGAHKGCNQAFTEDDDCIARSMSVRECYPEAKRAAEIMCASFYRQHGLETVVARLSHTYGAGASVHDNRATVQFLEKALAKEDIVLYSKGNQLRSYTYVADAASGILTVMINGEAGQAYNVANPDSRVTIADFAKELADISGVKCIFDIPDEIQKQEKTTIEYAILDSTRLESLGWQGKYSLKQGISRMYTIISDC